MYVYICVSDINTQIYKEFYYFREYIMLDITLIFRKKNYVRIFNKENLLK